jgi:hypothetical protein
MIYDDQSDYYNFNDTWLNAEEKNEMRKKELEKIVHYDYIFDAIHYDYLSIYTLCLYLCFTTISLFPFLFVTPTNLTL